MKNEQTDGCGNDDKVNLFAVPCTIFPLKYFARPPSHQTKWRGLNYAKFVGFFLLLWLPGFFFTYFTGSCSVYLSDWHYHFYSIMLTLLLFLLVNLCQQTASTLDGTKNVINNIGDQEFSKYVKRANNSSKFWYFFCVLAPVVFALSLEIYNQFFSQNLIVSGRLRVVNLDFVCSEVSKLNCPYAIYSSILLFLILGIGANRFIHYLVIINDYGKTFLQNASIDLLTPNSSDGFKAFRQLVLKSTLFCSLALTLSSLYFFEILIRKNTISIYWMGTIIVLVIFFIYTIFSQMKWIRMILSNSKKVALSIIDDKINESRQNFHDNSNLLTFTTLFMFRDRILNTPLWTFDTGFVSRSFLAVTVPILGGAMAQIILERLLNPIFP